MCFMVEKASSGTKIDQQYDDLIPTQLESHFKKRQRILWDS